LISKCTFILAKNHYKNTCDREEHKKPIDTLAQLAFVHPAAVDVGEFTEGIIPLTYMETMARRSHTLILSINRKWPVRPGMNRT
jgi:hypothetical protein